MEGMQTQLPALIEFNLLPARYIHSSWLKAVPEGDLVTKLASFPDTERHISKYLLKFFNLNSAYSYQVDPDLIEILMLPSENIIDLVFFTGTLINRERIKHLIDGKQVRSIQALMGDQLYYSALRLLLPELGNLKRYQTHGKNEANPVTWVKTDGIRCLESTINELPTPLKKRLLLKLPYQWSRTLERTRQADAGRRQLLCDIYNIAKYDIHT